MSVDPAFAGEWPGRADLLRAEADAFVLDPAAPDLPTRCHPWIVEDVTKHLAATFYRYNELVRRGMAGRFDAPFATEDLAHENDRAIASFPAHLDAKRALCEQVSRFCSIARDPAQPMPHHRGIVPVGLQARWGLAELAIHHDDVARANGRAYRPGEEVVEQVVPAYEVLFGKARAHDRWAWILEASGR